MTESKDLKALNNRYGISGHLLFVAGQGGLVTAEISNPYSSGAVTLAGGNVLSFIPKRKSSENDVFWMSPTSPYALGRAMRGGIPICWPWFGAHPEDPQGKPAHGFARTQSWSPVGTQILPDGSIELRLKLSDSPETLSLWPHAFELEFRVVFGEALRVELHVRNPGSQPFHYTGALHHYFYVSDVRQVSVLGLEGCEYLDKVENYARKHQDGSVRFEGQTDRIYLDTVGDCVIVDPGLNRKIRIAKEGSHTTVVWNPGEMASRMPDVGAGGQVNFVCVETANAAQDMIMVPAGSAACMTAVISVE
jgi:D-hexose-6-phosphate mutarotase